MKIKPCRRARGARADVTFRAHGPALRRVDVRVFFDDLGLRSPDQWLAVGSGSHAEQTGRVMERFRPIVADLEPDVVVVVGDVNSTLACALVAAKPARSLPMSKPGCVAATGACPRRSTGVVTDRVSDYLFATSTMAVDKPARGGYRPDQIPSRRQRHGRHALRQPRAGARAADPRHARPRSERVRADHAAPDRQTSTIRSVLKRLMTALEQISTDLPLVFPVHPRTSAQIRSEVQTALGHPVPRAARVSRLPRVAGTARLVLTDSGGSRRRRRAGGAVPHVARDHRAADHRGRRYEPARRPRSGTSGVCGPPRDRRRLAGATAGAVGRSRWPSASRRSWCATRPPGAFAPPIGPICGGRR